MITRRGFLGSILASAVAPAIVRADSLMRIIPIDTTILSEDNILYLINKTVDNARLHILPTTLYAWVKEKDILAYENAGWNLYKPVEDTLFTGIAKINEH